MTFRFILIFSLLFQTFGTWAQDSIPANTRTRIYFSPTESFVSQIYDNPAINYYAHTFSISELQIGWEQQNANKAFRLGSLQFFLPRIFLHAIRRKQQDMGKRPF